MNTDEIRKEMDKLTIKQAREEAGLSLADAAEAMGVSLKRMDWYENNPGEIEGAEAIALCKLYGTKLNEVSFKTDEVQEKECRVMYPSVRRMTFATSIKTKIAAIMLSITDDRAYSDQHVINDLLDILDDIENEEEIVINEISAGIESIKSKNHLNLSLAGH